MKTRLLGGRRETPTAAPAPDRRRAAETVHMPNEARTECAWCLQAWPCAGANVRECGQ